MTTFQFVCVLLVSNLCFCLDLFPFFLNFVVQDPVDWLTMRMTRMMKTTDHHPGSSQKLLKKLKELWRLLG